MDSTLKYDISTSVPVISDVDVLVVGGGPAGIAAAICSARRGRTVLLAEREYCLGGTATSGLVGPFMTCSNPDGTRMVIRGFFEELIQRLIAEGGAQDPRSIPHCDAYSSWHYFGHRNVTPFNSEILKVVAEDMCLEQGVKLLYGVQAFDAIRNADKSRVESVIFLAKDGLKAVNAKVVIDCTGDGDVAALAGCPMMKGDDETGEMQAAGLFFAIDGLDESALQARKDSMGWEAMRFMPEIEQAVANGEYPIPRRRLGMYKSCDGTWRANITRIPDVDGTKSEDLTTIAVEGRRQIRAIIKFLHKYVKGCENARLIESAATPGVRETRRIKGDFILREQSLIDGEVFPDTILVCSNSRDTHAGLVGKYIPQTTCYTLPYRMLVPSGVGNLLAAGRDVSCDRPTLAAIRVMPPCFGMGQAAGNAAALAIENSCNCADINVSELRKRLREENVVLDAK